MREASLKKKVAGWKEVETWVSKLAEDIQSSGFNPDIIIGIPRGGWVPARLLSTYLDVRILASINVVKLGKDRKIVSSLDLNLNGKNVLVVEDILETGNSLRVVMERLREADANAKSACIFYRRNYTQIKPDYFVGLLKQNVTFPWEISK
jgi:hypothetical protein